MVDKGISKTMITKKIRRYKTSYGKMFIWYIKTDTPNLSSNYEYQMTLVILNKILICLV